MIATFVYPVNYRRMKQTYISTVPMIKAILEII